jgi:hypothetical protein
MDVCIFIILFLNFRLDFRSRCFRKEQRAKILFSHLLFCSSKSFSFAGEWPNSRLVLRLAYLWLYIMNSLPYLELQRNIIAPEGFLENFPWHSLWKR